MPSSDASPLRGDETNIGFNAPDDGLGIIMRTIHTHELFYNAGRVVLEVITITK